MPASVFSFRSLVQLKTTERVVLRAILRQISLDGCHTDVGEIRLNQAVQQPAGCIHTPCLKKASTYTHPMIISTLEKEDTQMRTITSLKS